MLAKRTLKNQITLPKAVADRFPGVEYFEVRAEDNRIILEPVKQSRIGDVWSKLDRVGIGQADVAAAVKWARRPARKRAC
jgi:virulence-associated protein VagC